jgi:DNA-binding response OmpR family regulator
MLSGAHVLIAEDELLIAADLADHLEGFGATVVGPAASLRDGLRLATSEKVDTALLDFNLEDGAVTPLLDVLAKRGVATVVYTGQEIPLELRRKHPGLRILSKPLPMHHIVAELAAAWEAQS